MADQQELRGSNLEKDPADWKTGDEPMTGAQASYLRTLSDQAGEPFSMEYRLIGRDGRVVWVHDDAVVMEWGRPGRRSVWTRPSRRAAAAGAASASGQGVRPK